jgi:hypothetical protein
LLAGRPSVFRVDHHDSHPAPFLITAQTFVAGASQQQGSRGALPTDNDAAKYQTDQWKIHRHHSFGMHTKCWNR